MSEVQVMAQPNDEASTTRLSRSQSRLARKQQTNGGPTNGVNLSGHRAHYNYTWRVTGKQGGRFSNQSPRFSPCGRYLFLTVLNEAHVFSTATGELLQRMQHETSPRPIIALLLDPKNAYRLIGVYQDGHICVWDYTDGAILKTFQLADQRTIVAAALKGDILLVSDGKHVYTAEWSAQTSVLSCNQVAEMKACLGLACSDTRFFAWGGDKVDIFPIKDGKLGQYEQITLPGTATAFAAHVDQFAISDESGALYLYNLQHVKDRTPRKMHWHAHACSALSFALDGAYLLSGGQEGVLVLWQLATAGKQLLPRVGTAIAALGVSQGSLHYAVKLDENTVKIISASTLQATCTVAGPRRANVAAAGGDDETLLLAAGPQIQTWQWSTARASSLLHATAQSFAGPTASRNANGGTTAIQVAEPEVTHLALSVDGHLLCTADKWTTPASDAADLGYTKPHDVVTLKFWHRNSSSSNNNSAQGSDWQLACRIDAPHGHARLTGLQALPGGGFVTAAEDQAVKVWRTAQATSSDDRAPLLRCARVYRFAQSVTGLHARRTPCRMAVSADGSLLALTGPSSSNQADAGVVLLVDPARGKILTTLSGLDTGNLQQLAFVGGGHLVLVGSRRLVCWRVAESRAVYAVRWPERTYRASLTVASQQDLGFGAQAQAHFCIATEESKVSGPGPAVPQQTQGQGQGQGRPAGASKLFIFGTTGAKPLYREKCSAATLAVTAVGEGYAVLDDSLVLRRIACVAPAGTAVVSTESLAARLGASVPASQGISSIYGAGAIAVSQVDEENGQTRVLTSQTLEGFLPAASAQASLETLDDRMAQLGLYLLGAGKSDTETQLTQ